MRLILKEFLLSGRASFPEVGLYVLSKNPEGLFLVQQASSWVHFPFFSLQGGESWEGLLSRIKKEWQIENTSHRLLGVSAKRNLQEQGRAYCVFQLEAWPRTPSSQFIWQDFRKIVSCDDITTRIYNSLAIPSPSVWVD